MHTQTTKLPRSIPLGKAVAQQLRKERILLWQKELEVFDFKKSSPIVLELGCGHGHFLTEYAQNHPASICLGIDLSSKRILKAKAKAKKRQLNNLFFFKAKADEFVAALPQQSCLQTVFVLFPDPWPKKRHHKRRLIQTTLLDALSERLLSKGQLYFRSDVFGITLWTHLLLTQHPHFTPLLADTPWTFEASSFFQEMMSDWFSIIAKHHE